MTIEMHDCFHIRHASKEIRVDAFLRYKCIHLLKLLCISTAVHVADSSKRGGTCMYGV